MTETLSDKINRMQPPWNPGNEHERLMFEETRNAAVKLARQAEGWYTFDEAPPENREVIVVQGMWRIVE